MPAKGTDVVFNLHTHDTDPPLLGWIQPLLEQTLALAQVAQGQLGVTVVHDPEMTDLHVRYCDKPGTTDVLTFDLRDDPGDPLEGDVVICLDEAARQASERGHAVRDEVLLYAIHGLMHLLGEDDHDPQAYQRMHQREDELLTALGVGPRFDPPLTDPEGTCS